MSLFGARGCCSQEVGGNKPTLQQLYEISPPAKEYKTLYENQDGRFTIAFYVSKHIYSVQNVNQKSSSHSYLYFNIESVGSSVARSGSVSN
ncbi:hypothetical protein TNCV_853141 [Trichonephila clavipes]|nr:hypothetical protein TNCV_853141 [Trichonephila clavipes]